MRSKPLQPSYEERLTSRLQKNDEKARLHLHLDLAAGRYHDALEHVLASVGIAVPGEDTVSLLARVATLTDKGADAVPDAVAEEALISRMEYMRTYCAFFGEERKPPRQPNALTPLERKFRRHGADVHPDPRNGHDRNGNGTH